MSDEIEVFYKRRVVFAGRYCIRQSVDDAWYVHAYPSQSFESLEDAKEFLIDIIEEEGFDV